MKTPTLGLVILTLLACRSVSLRAEEPAARPAGGADVASFSRDVRPFLQKHCFHCHGKEDGGENEAGLTLSKYQDDLSVQQDRKLWDNVLHMLRSGEMPPKERPRPPAAEIEAVMQGITGVLANFDCNKARNVGRVTVRRLNRLEYNNTIRDLVGVDFKPAADFPADDVGYGFDNIGDVLSTTPLLLEKYLGAAEAIVQEAITLPVVVEPKDVRFPDLRVSDGAGEQAGGGAVLYASPGGVRTQGFLDAGEYILRIELYAKQVDDQRVRAAISINDQEQPEFEVTSTDREKLQTFEGKVRVPSGTTRITVGLANPYSAPDSTPESPNRRLLFVRSIVFDGPHNPPRPPAPPHQQKLMAHSAGAEPREAAREILSRFAARAFRRPVQAEEVESILKIYDIAEKEGQQFEERVRLALCRVLVSPHFLFRIENDPPGSQAGQSYLISELELASRLSYFLWCTMPDEELMSLAVRGELRQNLDAQIQRMLKDEKSAAFVTNFAGQWLTLSKLDAQEPDEKLFPSYDADLKAAMLTETEMFFESIVRENRSIFELIDSDFTFLNARLARHYGMAGVYGAEFRRVETPAERGGLLTQASILTLTSNATRTAPVKRGKWVLEQLLGTPPPPPPPDVPALEDQQELKGSLRQVMELHRKNPTCASCHARMDPIGFGFENFDAIGAWRDKDGQYAIDPSGELPDGQKFQGPGELKAILKSKKDLFARSLAEKMLTYATGRGVEYYDKCALDKMVEALAKNEYRFQTLLVETIKSEPFQMRTATGTAPPAPAAVSADQPPGD
jgi:hypothetical protein